MVESLGEIMLEKSKNVEGSLKENEEKQTKRTTLNISVWGFFLISIILSVVVSWNIFQQIHHRDSINKRLDLLENNISFSKIDEPALDPSFINLIEGRISKLDLELQALKKNRSKIDMDLTALREISDSNKEELSELSGSYRYIFDVSEALYLLRSANQRLQIMGDIDSAIAIAELVDELLLKINKSEFDAVRKTLSSDMSRLKSEMVIDVNNLLSRLSVLISKIESLKILELSPSNKVDDNQEREVPSENNLQFTFNEALKKLSNFIVIKKNVSQNEEILDPKLIVLLKKHISILLKHAQLAVLSKDSALYKLSLEEANVLLKEVQDSKRTNILDLNNEIDALQKIKIIQSPTNFSESIQELEKFMEDIFIENRK